MRTFWSRPVFLALAAAPVLVCVLSSTAVCQVMNISVYSDVSYWNGTVVATSSTSDNSSGCYHTGYSMNGFLQSPSGRYASDYGGSSVWVNMSLDEDFGDWDFGGSGYVYCSCIYGTFSYGGPTQWATISNHRTYFKTLIGYTNVTCLYSETNCLPPTTAVCTEGSAPAGPGIDPPQCPPWVVIYFVRIRHNDGTFECGGVGSGESSAGTCY